VPRIELLRLLLSRQRNFLGIDNNHEVAHVRVLRVRRLGLATKRRRNDGRDSPQSLPLGVDYVPSLPAIQIILFW
jgi:hypothetical protein